MAMEQGELTKKRKSLKVIDCDVHVQETSFDELVAYMDPHWKNFARSASQFKQVMNISYAIVANGGVRKDSWGENGEYPGSSVEFLKKQLLDEHGVNMAVLYPNGTFCLNSLPQDHWASAIGAALNDWLIDVWLSKDPRFKGTVSIAAADPEAAAREIDRVGGHPQMKQVGLAIHSPHRGYGDKFYDPIWEAAVRNNLVCTFHVSLPGGQNKYHATGAQKYYGEYQTLNCLTFQAQMASMVFGGVFEKFPELKVAFVEGGFGWVPNMMYTMDTHWKALRLETPWVKRYPSEYVKEHFWFGTQPFIESVEDHNNILKLIEMVGTDRLIFTSDYPHWEFDSPTAAFTKIPSDIRRKILFENPVNYLGLTEKDIKIIENASSNT
ncbi:amidohydrolase [Bacillus sp. AGMB 02131]|uniref:Amidohydrolase n=1 Tax=Peribacillus faecalis TaxID=2772559 RepID=A0A927CWK5_9BACI|nr:amidohydrolase family protein [Peribacillus faecalis]MBD3107290.1 amidohydrolase [Peribacillus faecalis]